LIRNPHIKVELIACEIVYNIKMNDAETQCEILTKVSAFSAEEKGSRIILNFDTYLPYYKTSKPRYNILNHEKLN